MTNSPGYNAGGYGDPGGAYGGYAQAAPKSRNAARSRSLWIAAAALGLISFAVSFGSPVSLGWAVWFGVLAAVVAAVGLIPQQGNRGWLVVTLAVTGFLVALSSWVPSAGDAGWAATVVVVLNALQAVAAVAALLLEGGDREGAGGSDESDYVAYAKYMQAYQAYAMQYQQGPPPRVSPAGQATAAAQGQASAQARSAPPARGQAADAAQESYEAVQARYAQQGGYSAAPQQHRGAASAPPAAAAPDPGLPSYGRGPVASPQYGEQQERPEESAPN